MIFIHQKINFIIFLFSLKLFILSIFSMETDPDDNNDNNNYETVININKTEQENINSNKKFIGKFRLTEILPLELWCEIASYLKYNDPALVYFLGPSIGLTEKQAQKIAQKIYELAIIKTSQSYNLLELENVKNCLKSYKDEKSKLLVRSLTFQKLPNTEIYEYIYGKIYKSLSFQEKVNIRLASENEKIKKFWNDIIKNLDEKYDLATWQSLPNLSDKKFIELCFTIYKIKLMLSKYKNFDLSFQSEGIKALVFYAFCFITIIWLLVPIILNEHYISFGALIPFAISFIIWISGKKSYNKLYLDDFNTLVFYCEREWKMRKFL